MTRTFTIQLDLGFRIHEELVLTRTTVQRFRLAHINTPELHGAADGGVAGRRSKAELERLLALGPLRVTSLKEGEDFKPDKYGRVLGVVEVASSTLGVLCINDELVRTGFAKPYEGQGEKPI